MLVEAIVCIKLVNVAPEIVKQSESISGNADIFLLKTLYFVPFLSYTSPIKAILIKLSVFMGFRKVRSSESSPAIGSADALRVIFVMIPIKWRAARGALTTKSWLICNPFKASLFLALIITFIESTLQTCPIDSSGL